jgi:hypothetical protein
MDNYITAFKMGQQSARLEFEKEANAQGMADLLRALGTTASKGAEGIGSALKKVLGGAELTGRGAKYIGTTADPRAALALGGGAALASSLIPAISAYEQHGLTDAIQAGLPGAVASLGAGLAVGANPGMLGGSPVNRITHELAMGSATPAGTVATMAGLVGLPAALIAYGKMKGEEESSLF